MGIMTNVVVDDDPISGSKLVYHFDPVSEKATLEDRQDVTALIERNKRLQNGPPTVSKTKEWEMIASIPANIHAELKRKGIITSMHEDPWQRKLLKWLKDHPAFRTSLRRIA